MIRVALSILGAVLAAIAFYYLSRDLVPPDRLRLAAGAEGGGYYQLALRYRQILARDGIAVEVLATEGSIENARLLSTGTADAALLQGGIVPEAAVETLGSIFMEPVFVFVRTEADTPRNTALWAGQTIAAGAQGSGTRAAVEALLAAARLGPGDVTLLPLGGSAAADAILAGEADIAIFVAPVSAPYLEPLFRSDEVEIAALQHLDTLSRRLPDSSVMRLPSGSFSLAPPIPSRELPMLTLVASLVAQPDLHPALVDRLVEAAREIHGPRDIISDDGDFPTMAQASLPADAYAGDLIADGPSPLGSFLPYWMVAQISRFAILLLPIFLILLPLLRALPGVYVWRMRRRVFKHYSEIRAIDRDVLGTESSGKLKQLGARLDEIEAQLAQLDLPLPYREYAYTARLHIDLIRRRIAERMAAA